MSQKVSDDYPGKAPVMSDKQLKDIRGRYDEFPNIFSLMQPSKM